MMGKRTHQLTGRAMVYVAAQPVSGADVAEADELAEVRWFSMAGIDELRPAIHEPAREYLRRGLVSAKSWVVVALAVAALCILIGIALTASLDFVFIALVAMAAIVVTYFAGRLDDRRGDG